MAEIAPRSSVTVARPQAGALRVPRLGVLLPPLMLVLLTLLALTAAYAVRPSVVVDLGDYADSIYISGFHDREIGSSEPGTTTPWPVDAAELVIPGRFGGVAMITVESQAALPDDTLKLIALAVNGERVGIARRWSRGFVATLPPDLGAAETLTLRLVPALSGNPDPPPGLAAQVQVAPAYTYRWSREVGVLSFPGLGAGPWQASFAAILRHPDGEPLNTTILANGVPIGQLPDAAVPRRYTMLVPDRLVPDGTLTLAVKANVYRDPRPLGALLSEVRVAPVAQAPILPPLDAAGASLVVALGMYVCLTRISLRPWLAAGAAATLVLTGSWWLAEARFPTAFLLPRLALLAIWSVALLLALERFVPWLAQRAGIPFSPVLLRGLLLIFFVGYWLKSGGMLYPYFVGIDVSWHIDRARWILDGQLPLLYGTNSPLNESTMPEAEWGAIRPVIPYSPWFHMLAATFVLLPMPMVMTANLLSALLDCSRVFLIPMLARALGLSERASFMAALLYAVTPATFLLHSWGNLPTTFGMWFTLAATIYLVTAYRQLDRPWVFLGLTLLLTATLLIYTVMAVFMLLFLGLLVPALWLSEGRAQRRSALVLGGISVAALGLATLIYYGQYIQPIIERTIPYFLTPHEAGAAQVQRDPFDVYLAKYWPRMGYLRETGSYGLQLALLIGLPGLFFVREQRWRVLLGCWLAVALVFMVVGSRISMVDKHLFYILPVLAISVGAVLSRFWRRGLAAQLAAVGVFGVTLISALELWFYRIVAVRQ